MDASSAEVLSAIRDLLNVEADIRKHAETKLYGHMQQLQFTINLLNSVGDSTIDYDTRFAAARFFQNFVYHGWYNSSNARQSRIRIVRLSIHMQQAHFNLPCPEGQTRVRVTIPDSEKEAIKKRFFQVVCECAAFSDICLQLLDAFITINQYHESEKWMVDSLLTFIRDVSSLNLVKWGLTFMLEFIKIQSVRHYNDNDNLLVDTVKKAFSLFESVIPHILLQSLPQVAECLHVIHAIYLRMHQTRKEEMESLFNSPQLTTFFDLHIRILDHPSILALLDEDPISRPLHPWTAATEGCLLSLTHIPGVTDEKKFHACWTVVKRWKCGEIWLLDKAICNILYFFISLLKTSSGLLVTDMLESIVTNLIFLSLDSTQSTTQLFREDSKDYLTLILPTRELPIDYTFWKRSLVANTDIALGQLMEEFPENYSKKVAKHVTDTISKRFNRQAENKSLLAIALKADGALRALRVIKDFVSRNIVSQEQVTEMLMKFVHIELASDMIESFPWLSARTCHVLLSLSKSHYEAIEILTQSVLEAVLRCINQKNLFVLQNLAYEALESLSCFNSIDRYRDKLTSHATDIVPRLVESFHLLISLDDERQARAIQKAISAFIEISCHDVIKMQQMKFVNVVKCVFSKKGLLTRDTIPIMHTFANSIKDVLTEIWDIYLLIVKAYHTHDKQDCSIFLVDYAQFFRCVIKRGFLSLPIGSPHIEPLMELCLAQIKGNRYFECSHAAFEILEMAAASLGEKIAPILPLFLEKLHKVSQTYIKQSAGYETCLNGFLYVRVLLAVAIANPDTILKFINDKGFVKRFFSLWNEYRSAFLHLYGLKLQTLASSLILRLEVTVMIPFKFRKKMFRNLCRDAGSLPSAIEAPDFLTRKCNHPPDSRVSGDSECRDCNAFWCNLLDSTLPPRMSPLYDVDIVSVMRETVGERRLWASVYIPVDDDSD